MPKLKSSCHCGAVELEIDLPNGFDVLRRCNCSICARRGVIAATVPLDSLRIAKGKDVLSLYKFNTHKAKHYFCSICGIYTHHQRFSDQNTYGVNIGCIEGIDPYDQPNLTFTDAKNR